MHINNNKNFPALSVLILKKSIIKTKLFNPKFFKRPKNYKTLLLKFLFSLLIKVILYSIIYYLSTLY